MKIQGAKHHRDAHNADLSGSVFDVDLSGLPINQANLAGVSIVGGRREGMIIEAFPFWTCCPAGALLKRRNRHD